MQDYFEEQEIVSLEVVVSQGRWCTDVIDFFVELCDQDCGYGYAVLCGG